MLSSYKKNKDIFNYILTKKEKFLFLLTTSLNFFGIFLEMFSLALIIPVFNFIFFNNLPNNFLFFSIFNNLKILSEFNTKMLIVVFLIIFFFIKTFLLIIFNYLYLKFINLMSIRLSNDLYKLYIEKDFDFFLSDKSNNILRKITIDITGVRNYLVSLQIILIETFFIFFISILLLYNNYKIFSFILLIFGSVLYFYMIIIKKRIQRWSILYQENVGSLQNLIVTSVKGIKDLIIYNLYEIFFKKFSDYTKNTYVPAFKQDFINTVARYWMELIAVLSVLIPLGFILLGQETLNNHLISELIPFLALFAVSIFKIVPSINRILNSYQGMKFYTVSLDIIYNEFLYLKKANIISNDEIIFKYTLEFKNIRFTFKKNSPEVLKNINFKIQKGECVAILGSNGSGKSTFLNILSGLLKPSEGKIIIDNKETVIHSNKSWINKISYVQQNIFLLNSTIKENIVLSQGSNCNEEKFLEISKILYLDEAFSKFELKLETIIGEDGAFLSGGQKQLISIARALYKKSEIIIFDEADSSLDVDRVLNLRNTILLLKNKITIIFVTHDVNLLKDCFTKIYQIENNNFL
jgi:ABC-type bacteriocin/lantibiotic exporter with double-glycine peptidase domain